MARLQVRSAEYDWAEVPYPTAEQGRTEAVGPADDDDHEPHVFVYVPDLTMETGWSTHRVPERTPERARRPVGFRRHER